MAEYSKKTVIKYSMLQIPGLVLFLILLLIIRHWFQLSSFVFRILLAVWILKDAVLFFYTWKAYDSGDTDRMINAFGIALEDIYDTGYVLVNGEKWKAVLLEESQVVKKGQKVYISGRKGLVLHVRREDNKS